MTGVPAAPLIAHLRPLSRPRTGEMPWHSPCFEPFRPGDRDSTKNKGVAYMFNHKLILSTLVAGCLSLGSALAQDKRGLTDEQKAKLAELKAKIEAMRNEHKSKHDSLKNLHKD